ncbi:hypothetical protein [Paenirhodobacter sp.]|uniref:hypothetical protein n=1 Tax=Paenirhodobacter sp. TaxID=1965326 RepID=UPI003B3D5CE8
MEILSKDIVDGLRSADAGRRSRLRIRTGGDILPVLRCWRGGFSLDAEQIRHLRGLVDLYDGARHLSTCLIVASDVEGGELICTVKRETPVTDHAPLDFERAESAPAGLLPFRA